MNIKDIKNPEFLKDLSYEECDKLALDIREFLIESVSTTGGHLSSNLGIVELTIAMHRVFETPNDKFLYDVGHQAYIHKILTGRADRFDTLRQYKGLSGFQKFNESEHDAWEAGHSSTSLSGALGLAIARDLEGKSYNVVPVIGDGSLFNGMSFEALNHIGHEARKLIIVLNDNDMSISANVGGLTKGLTKLRTSKPYNSFKNELKGILGTNKIGYAVLDIMRDFKKFIKHETVDQNVFGEFNIEYLGPIDGHNIKELESALQTAKSMNKPVLVHVLTKKGKGYKYAENDVDGKWHGIGPFNIEDGTLKAKGKENFESWSKVMSNSLCRLAKDNEKIVAITPAMIQGSKLDNFFRLYPNRSFDCGIAESHAMTLAAGLAVGNKHPYVCIYSSFLQRAYDQINHDICRMNLPCVIGVDRAGLVGEDGETHHGVFDISMLKSIPNLIVSQPKNANEAQDMLATAFNYNGPFLIRYPRGSLFYEEKDFEIIEIGTWTYEQKNETNDTCVITYGDNVELLCNDERFSNVDIINARFINPLDTNILNQLIDENKKVVVYETDMLKAGLASSILEYLSDNAQFLNLVRIGIKDEYVVAGSLNKLKDAYNISLDDVLKAIEQIKE